MSTNMKIRVTILGFLYAAGVGRANSCVLAVLIPNAVQIKGPDLLLLKVVTEIALFHFSRVVDK